MSRRARALGFGALAGLCAVVAAAMAAGYRGEVSEQLGELRAVVVTRAPLPGREALRPGAASRLLEVRRVPARFAPPDALPSVAEAIGREPLATIPTGSYLAASLLREPGGSRRRSARAPLAPGRHPVQLAVTGAEALAGGGGAPGARVDVIVTTEPGPGGGEGRTYVAAERVELIALTEGSGAGGAGGAPLPGPSAWTATLGLTRDQALRLIHAESFARQVRLIASGG